MTDDPDFLATFENKPTIQDEFADMFAERTRQIQADKADAAAKAAAREKTREGGAATLARLLGEDQ